MIYEYKCECNKITELSCMFKGRPDIIDCSCGKKAKYMEVPTKIGIQFKGTGFYSTDNQPRKGDIN